MGISTLGKHFSMALLGFFLAMAMISSPMPSVNSTITYTIKPKTEIQNPPTVAKIKNSILKQVNDMDLACLSTNIYYEAGGQSFAGKLAVGMVVLNRIQNPSYPKTICGVVYDANEIGCQFSWTCGADIRPINEDSFGWRSSVNAALTLLSRDRAALVDLTDGALYFHSKEITPDWSNRKRKTAKIDDHIFYK